MIMSMTGYGRSLKENGNCQVTVEMKAVNHRFCEINIRMPRQFFFLEDQLKKIISRFIKRGKVDVFINLQGESVVNRSLTVDWDLFHQYEETYERMAKLNDSPQPFPVERLLLQEDIVGIQESDEVTEDLKELVLFATEDAVQSLLTMRKKEGKALYEDLENRINSMSQWAIELREYAPMVHKNYRERLTKRVKEFLSGKLEVDEARMLTEVAIYADKYDIQEELTRIDSHLKQFLHILNQQDVVGRKLDFLVQELNRETNTIGSKANDVSISQTVVNLKSELEKIREQVQNVE
ncbi:YicC family protein [Evansella sp. AB-P1]|uniref:YicC/YloC family endoribonuclease n=1 Tax=Evansella sp. AB-P1 TaxID=3037653 RepID=UPI00241E5571|nr:YicC/YloC family endoribonuclease [Evansella sp. AB-P1]MDG5788252.1 YicC family protein [Evansella sp. AB-P1]